MSSVLPSPLTEKPETDLTLTTWETSYSLYVGWLMVKKLPLLFTRAAEREVVYRVPLWCAPVLGPPV